MSIDPQLYSSPHWTSYYVLAAYAMFGGCLFHAIKMGIIEFANRRDDSLLARLSGASTQVLFLVFFVLMYWLLESGAHTFTPYYVYSLDFPDRIPMKLFVEPERVVLPITECPDLVRWLGQEVGEFHDISLSVLLMEASLTYTGMWTALILGVEYRLVPLWGGLFVLLVDALLDPVVAGKYDCQGASLPVDGPGLGFWHWFLPTGQADYLASFFGVPLFNYAAWFAGPVVLISAAMVVQYLRGRVWRRVRGLGIVQVAPRGGQAAVIFILFVAGGLYYLLTFLAPSEQTREIPIWVQRVAFASVVVLAAGMVLARARTYQTRGAADPNLTLPPSVFLILPGLAMLIEGLFLQIAGLIALGLVVIVLGLSLTLWPYGQVVLRILQRVIDLDRFIRIAYFGFPSTLVLLGAFSVGIERTPGGLEFDVTNWQIGGLLTAALAFQVFAYVSNDVIDLPVDRTQPKRQRDPLVRGAIGVETALALALVQIPVALMVSFLLSARPLAYLVLLAGFGLMTVYNVFGKRSRLPPLTDFIQALAWAALALYAALIVDSQRQSDNWVLVWAVFIFGAGFIMLISGVHGGLRDFANDRGHGRWTTARLLGARLSKEDGAVLGSGCLRAYAYAVHLVMFVLPALIALDAVPAWISRTGVELELEERRYLGILFLVVFVASQLVLWRVVREREPRRDAFISLWGLVVMQAPLLAFDPFLGKTLLSVVLACFYAPLLTTKQLLKWVTRRTHPAIADRIEDPPSGGRSSSPS